MFLADSGYGRGPTDDFWYQPLPRGAAGGIISADQAMTLSIVWTCVRILAETVGSTPLQMFRRIPHGKERVTDHPLAYLVGRRPNAWQTSMEWREMMQVHLALRGNAYSRIVSDSRGQITALIPIHPDNVKVQVLANNLPRYAVQRPDGGEDTYVMGEILHLRGMSSDGYVGLNPIECLRQSLGEAMDAQDYGARFYANDAQSSRWIELPGNFKNDEDRQRFRERWQASQTGAGRWKTPVFEAGAKLHEMTINHADAQFLETRKYKDSDIARIFRIPAHKAGIMERATFSNIEQQAIEFATDTMQPWFSRWEQMLTAALIDSSGQSDLFFEFNLNGLMRGDAAARSNFYREAILDGWMTRNEVRGIENLNPLTGLDEPLEPRNSAPAGTQITPETA